MASFRVVCIFILIMESSVFSKNLGVYGELFEIAESDLLEEIQTKLQALEESGKLAESQAQIQKRVIENITKPNAISGVVHTQKPRTFEFDPTIEVTQDLKDHQDRVFAKKGDKYNPCDHARFSKVLLFIDGTSKDHIAWLKRKAQKHKSVKVVLVSGSPLKLSEELGIPIFFDQHGLLIKKLGIKQVPAMVLQEKGKKVLTIKEEVSEESIYEN